MAVERECKETNAAVDGDRVQFCNKENVLKLAYSDVTQLFNYTHTKPLNYTLKWVNFVVHKLQLNKAIF